MVPSTTTTSEYRSAGQLADGGNYWKRRMKSISLDETDCCNARILPSDEENGDFRFLKKDIA
jgi:hypothetical protein